MSNGDESEEWDDLVKISDDGPNNNFAEFELKNKLTLEVFDLWKYIEGPLSDPPVIPTLVTPKTVHGINIRTNEPCTLVTFGNAEEVRHAELDAEPWFHGDACALSKILDSVPDHKTHVVRTAKYAKQAWEALCSYYKRSNSIRAASIKWDIKSYLCDSSMDVRLWLNDMQRMYGQICAMDLDCMTDREFAMAILDLMPLDSGWRYFIARLREETLEKEADGVKVNSMLITTLIREKYRILHRDDPQYLDQIFSARSAAETSKRKRQLDHAANAPRSSTRNKRRRRNEKRCTNPQCPRQVGHEVADCFAFRGGKSGIYPDWWRGPWNLHMPETQRNSANNIPSSSHPAFVAYKGRQMSEISL